MRVVCKLKTSPRFISIDDNLHAQGKSQIDPLCRAAHRIHFQEVMAMFWKQPAPWEITSVVNQLQLEVVLAVQARKWSVTQQLQSIVAIAEEDEEGGTSCMAPSGYWR
jgi:hypothetical protein